jgi:hypothetical protein
MRRDPVNRAHRRVVIGAGGAAARQDPQRVNADLPCDSERPAGEEARHVRAVSALRAGRIAVIGGWTAGSIRRAGDEIADPVGASHEFPVRPPDPGVDDVGVDAGPVTVQIESAVERKRGLIETVEMPRHAAGRKRRRRAEDDEHGRVDGRMNVMHLQVARQADFCYTCSRMKTFRPCLAEFLGTFYLCFPGIAAILATSRGMDPGAARRDRARARARADACDQQLWRHLRRARQSGRHVRIS